MVTLFSWVVSLFFLGLVLFSAAGVQAQEQVDDFIACLPDVIDARITVAGRTLVWLSFDEWDSLHELSGRNIWISYENGGWDLDEPVYVVYILRGHSVVDYSPVEIWIALGEDEWYWFPFNNTEIFCDANGNHCGQHPCGGYAVPREDSIEWLRGVS